MSEKAWSKIGFVAVFVGAFLLGFMLQGPDRYDIGYLDGVRTGERLGRQKARAEYYAAERAAMKCKPGEIVVDMSRTSTTDVGDGPPKFECVKF